MNGSGEDIEEGVDTDSYLEFSGCRQKDGK
jgi:hypothetical protein